MTLDMFLFSKQHIPYTKQLRLFDFGEINGKQFNGYIYQGEQCYTLHQIAQLSKEYTYSQIRQSFYRLRKNLPIKKRVHYEKLRSDKLSHLGIKQKRYIYLLYPVCVLLLAAGLKGKEPELYIKLAEFYIEERIKKQKYLNYRPQNVYNLPRMGGKYYTVDMDQVDSRGEMIIDNILYTLRIPHQPSVPYHQHKIIPDFVIKTEPKQIIEYWGLNEEEQHNWKYQNNKKRKLKIYQELGWNIFNVGWNEVDHEPKLRKRIYNHFKKKE